MTAPGELVEADTVHYICPLTKRRRYVYTVVDLCARMAYAEVASRIGPGIAARTILRVGALAAGRGESAVGTSAS